MAPKKRGRKSPEPSYVEAEQPRVDPEHFDDFSNLRLKDDHAARPLWICPDLSIFLEARAAHARPLDFRQPRVTAAAAPPAGLLPAVRAGLRLPRRRRRAALAARDGPRVQAHEALAVRGRRRVDRHRGARSSAPAPFLSRTLRALRRVPSLTHTHTPARLEQNIIKVLDRLSKCDLPVEVVQFVRDSTRNFGKAKLVLKHNRHYIEAADAEVLRKLLKNKTVADARNADDARAGDAAAASSDADGFQVNDALVEMDANLEYRLLADEVRACVARAPATAGGGRGSLGSTSSG